MERLRLKEQIVNSARPMENTRKTRNPEIEQRLKRNENSYKNLFEQMEKSVSSSSDKLKIDPKARNDNKNREILEKTVNILQRTKEKPFERINAMDEQMQILRERMEFLDQCPEAINKAVWRGRFENLQLKLKQQIAESVMEKRKKTEVKVHSFARKEKKKGWWRKVVEWAIGK